MVLLEIKKCLYAYLSSRNNVTRCARQYIRFPPISGYHWPYFIDCMCITKGFQNLCYPQTHFAYNIILL